MLATYILRIMLKLHTGVKHRLAKPVISNYYHSFYGQLRSRPLFQSLRLFSFAITAMDDLPEEWKRLVIHVQREGKNISPKRILPPRGG